MAKRKILFLCTGNSCRSQIAESLLRHIADERFESLSAGSHPAGYIHPLAINVFGSSRRMEMALGCDQRGGFEAYRAAFNENFVPPDENIRREQKRRWLAKKRRG